MTLTINVPVFPMRKEIAARKRRLGLKISAWPFHDPQPEHKSDQRYSRDGFEFDVSGFTRGSNGPAGR